MFLLCGFEILCLVELVLLAYSHRETGSYTVASRMRFSIKRRGYSSPKAQKGVAFLRRLLRLWMKELFDFRNQRSDRVSSYVVDFFQLIRVLFDFSYLQFFFGTNYE